MELIQQHHLKHKCMGTHNSLQWPNYADSFFSLFHPLCADIYCAVCWHRPSPILCVRLSLSLVSPELLYTSVWTPGSSLFSVPPAAVRSSDSLEASLRTARGTVATGSERRGWGQGHHCHTHTHSHCQPCHCSCHSCRQTGRVKWRKARAPSPWHHLIMPLNTGRRLANPPLCCYNERECMTRTRLI